MSSETMHQNFRGVLCRHCGKPVRVPGLVMKKESDSRTPHDENDSSFQLTSRVFVLRCRACQRESVYNINQIVDCVMAQPAAQKAQAASV
jgi:hypothetical protein